MSVVPQSVSTEPSKVAPAITETKTASKRSSSVLRRRSLVDPTDPPSAATTNYGSPLGSVGSCAPSQFKDAPVVVGSEVRSSPGSPGGRAESLIRVTRDFVFPTSPSDIILFFTVFARTRIEVYRG